jgi:hypothetical protein
LESPLYSATIEFPPTQGKDGTVSVPAPGAGEVADPNVILPRAVVVGALAPGHWTVSLTVIVPVGEAVAVQFTLAESVACCPITKALGVETSFTTLETWERAGCASRSRISKMPDGLTRTRRIRKPISHLTCERLITEISKAHARTRCVPVCRCRQCSRRRRCGREKFESRRQKYREASNGSLLIRKLGRQFAGVRLAL